MSLSKGDRVRVTYDGTVSSVHANAVYIDRDKADNRTWYEYLAEVDIEVLKPTHPEIKQGDIWSPEAGWVPVYVNWELNFFWPASVGRSRDGMSAEEFFSEFPDAKLITRKEYYDRTLNI